MFTQRYLVHITFKVSSSDTCICNYSTLLSVVIELINMWMATIVTSGIATLQIVSFFKYLFCTNIAGEMGARP